MNQVTTKIALSPKLTQRSRKDRYQAQAMPTSLPGLLSHHQQTRAPVSVLGSFNAGAAQTQGDLDPDRGKEAPL